MASSSTSTFTIQPWTQEATTNNTLHDVLNRAQRGHLRGITESTLQEEIAAEGALDLSSTSSSSDSENEEDAETTLTKKTPFGRPSTREDLYKAKRYMLEAINAARQEVDVSLDLMSLVVSKELPRQAQTTLGEYVKEKVPLGTMGVDFWQRMPRDEAREAQEKVLAANVKMDSLQNAADGLLGAARRMEENVRRETQYWDQILSVSRRGWNVCRVPGQQHRLGVRFGFSESAPQFSRKGIAALNPDRDGGIRLERGIGSKPKALRAVLRKGGKVLGVSRMPDVQDVEETTLEARMRYARDSLFDEELYHEIIRESRTLASLGVDGEGSKVHLRNVSSGSKAAGEMKVELDLVSLDEDNSISDVGNEKDNLAQATILTARLLLSQSHRDRLRKRSEPPPPLSEKQKDEKPIMPILRPIMSLMLHRSALDQVTAYLTSVTDTLRTAKIEHTLHQPNLPFPIAGTENENTTAESLLTTTLLRPLTSSAILTISPPTSTSLTDESQTLNITLETSLAQAFGTVYTLHPPQPPTSKPGPGAPIHHFNDFTTFASAISCFLSSALAEMISPLVQDAGRDAGHQWQLRDHEAVLERDVGVGEAEESFRVELDGVGQQLRMVCQGKERKVFTWTAQTAAEGGDGFFETATKCLT